VLDEQQAQAATKEEVLGALSQIATKFRTRVGESLATMEKYDTPLAEATTASLEALKSYSAALKAIFSTDFAAAVPLLKRAIEIDPNFALAHAHLGVLYRGSGESDLSVASATKAYQLRNRATDRERLFITATYQADVTGNLEKARETFELWGRTYPRDPIAPGILSAFITHGSGKYEKSIEAAEKAIALDPNLTPPYRNVAFSYARLNRLAEAETALQRLAADKQDAPDFLVLRYLLFFLKGDARAMEQVAAFAKGKPGAEDGMSQIESLVLARSGRLRLARQMSRRAVELPKHAGKRDRAALFQSGAAVWEALFGNTTAARRSATEVLQLSRGRDVQYGAALALAIIGDFARAQELANDLDKRFPEDTCVRFSYLPVLRARLALNRGMPSQAVESLQAAIPNEFAVPGVAYFAFYGGLFPAYLRGEALLAAQKGTEAAVEFQKILDHPAVVFGDPVGALAHVQLGRAFALSGERMKARTAYQNFFTLWKDADTDIPILQQARAEYTRLR
jgi:tetratricopeptide (TPR) repeat protein